MPRFVLLRHECPPDFEKPSHWDFMLEWHGVLRTWELRELPTTWINTLEVKTSAPSTVIENPKRTTVGAFPLPDHRLVYLDFEGPISQGRGEVICCDRGSYTLHAATPTQLTLQLTGEHLRELVCLKQTNSQWELSHWGE